jgi:hypothetical protein
MFMLVLLDLMQQLPSDLFCGLQSHRYGSQIVERNVGNVTTKNLHLLMKLQLGHC